MEMELEEFLQYIRDAKSESTLKEYKYGINAFVNWFGKDANTILAMRHEDVVSGERKRKKRFARELEKFHAWLLQPIHTIRTKPNQKYSINTARTMCLGLMQLFRYFEIPITLEAQSEVSKTVISIRDFQLTPQHLRRMFKVADLRGRVIVSLGKDLAWRIGDVSKLRKDALPDLEQEAPILFEFITEKEDVLAKSFLSAETVELLKTYLPTLPSDNPYLFPSNKNKNLDAESINRVLKELAKKSKIRIPSKLRLRFHCFRKLFLSTCADLKIDVNSAKIMCGKSVKKDMLTYLGSVKLKNAFIEVQRELSITKPMKEIGMKDERIRELEERLKKQEWMMEAMTKIYGEETKTKARKEYEELLGKEVSADLALGEILLEVGKKLEEQRRAEYQKIIDENNNNS